MKFMLEVRRQKLLRKLAAVERQIVIVRQQLAVLEMQLGQANQSQAKAA